MSESQLNTIIARLDKSSTNAEPNKKLAKLRSRKSSNSRNASNNRVIKESKFLTSQARGIFNHLKQAFTKALIF